MSHPLFSNCQQRLVANLTKLQNRVSEQRSAKKQNPMRYLPILASFALIGCSTTVPQLHPSASTAPVTRTIATPKTIAALSTYLNRRFGFKLVYPSELHSSRQPDNGAGLTFSSSDGRFSVTAQAHFLSDSSLDSMWADDLRDEGDTVTYSLKKPTFYVLSGTRNGKEYYRKVFVRGGNWARFDISYSASERQKYDPVVEQIARDFIPFLDGDYDRVPQPNTR
jgi:hypothetical protein